MQLKDIDQYWDLLCAAREGKTIQVRQMVTGDWKEATEIHWNISPTDYRIKPEPLVLWVNEYHDNYSAYKTEAQALHYRTSKAIRTIKMQEAEE